MTEEHPQNWQPKIPKEDVRRALQQVEIKATEHGGDYTAGMRNARQIIESELDL